MILNIGGKDYELNFGFRFLEEVGEEFGLSPEIEGTNIPLKMKGAGIMYMLLDDKDFVTVHKVIRLGTITLKQQPSDEDIKDFLYELLEESIEGDVDVYEEFIENLKKNIEENPVIRYELGVN